MVILEPDGTVSNAGWDCGNQPQELPNELVAVAGVVLDHVHYSFDVPGFGLVALYIDRELATRATRQHFALVRSGQG